MASPNLQSSRARIRNYIAQCEMGIRTNGLSAMLRGEMSGVKREAGAGTLQEEPGGESRDLERERDAIAFLRSLEAALIEDIDTTIEMTDQPEDEDAAPPTSDLMDVPESSVNPVINVSTRSSNKRTSESVQGSPTRSKRRRVGSSQRLEASSKQSSSIEEVPQDEIKVLGCDVGLAREDNSVASEAFQAKRNQEPANSDSAQITDSQRHQDASDIFQPIPGDIYVVNRKTTKTSSAVLLLPWENLDSVGVSSSLEDLGLTRNVPTCCIYNRRSKSFKWRKGYEDDGPLFSERQFPVLYFDGQDLPLKSRAGWVLGKDLAKFDLELAKSSLDVGYRSVEKFIRERGVSNVENNEDVGDGYVHDNEENGYDEDVDNDGDNYVEDCDDNKDDEYIEDAEDVGNDGIEGGEYIEDDEDIESIEDCCVEKNKSNEDDEDVEDVEDGIVRDNEDSESDEDVEDVGDSCVENSEDSEDEENVENVGERCIEDSEDNEDEDDEEDIGDEGDEGNIDNVENVGDGYIENNMDNEDDEDIEDMEDVGDGCVKDTEDDEDDEGDDEDIEDIEDIENGGDGCVENNENNEDDGGVEDGEDGGDGCVENPEHSEDAADIENAGDGGVESSGDIEDNDDNDGNDGSDGSDDDVDDDIGNVGYSCVEDNDTEEIENTENFGDDWAEDKKDVKNEQRGPLTPSHELLIGINLLTKHRGIREDPINLDSSPSQSPEPEFLRDFIVRHEAAKAKRHSLSQDVPKSRSSAELCQEAVIARHSSSPRDSEEIIPRQETTAARSHSPPQDPPASPHSSELSQEAELNPEIIIRRHGSLPRDPEGPTPRQETTATRSHSLSQDLLQSPHSSELHQEAVIARHSSSVETLPHQRPTAARSQSPPQDPPQSPHSSELGQEAVIERHSSSPRDSERPGPCQEATATRSHSSPQDPPQSHYSSESCHDTIATEYNTSPNDAPSSCDSSEPPIDRALTRSHSQTQNVPQSRHRPEHCEDTIVVRCNTLRNDVRPSGHGPEPSQNTVTTTPRSQSTRKPSQAVATLKSRSPGQSIQQSHQNPEPIQETTSMRSHSRQHDIRTSHHSTRPCQEAIMPTDCSPRYNIQSTHCNPEPYQEATVVRPHPSLHSSQLPTSSAGLYHEAATRELYFERQDVQPFSGHPNLYQGATAVGSYYPRGYTERTSEPQHHPDVPHTAIQEGALNDPAQTTWPAQETNYMPNIPGQEVFNYSCVKPSVDWYHAPSFYSRPPDTSWISQYTPSPHVARNPESFQPEFATQPVTSTFSQSSSTPWPRHEEAPAGRPEYPIDYNQSHPSTFPTASNQGYPRSNPVYRTPYSGQSPDSYKFPAIQTMEEKVANVLGNNGVSDSLVSHLTRCANRANNYICSQCETRYQTLEAFIDHTGNRRCEQSTR